MPYLVNEPYHASQAERKARYNPYREYLQSVQKRLPTRALEFASAEWHYDVTDHRCPHDAWVQSLSIVEPASGERHENRITYPGVRRYSLFQPLDHRLLAPPRGHGDWLVDEIAASDNGRPEQPLVIHEILFSRQGVWTIEAEDIAYEWKRGQEKLGGRE